MVLLCEADVNIKVIPYEEPLEQPQEHAAVAAVHPVLPGSEPSERDKEEALKLYQSFFGDL